jgi:hydrogenase maturation protease
LRRLILGLGNPVRSDDAVGLEVVERLRAAPLPDHLDLADAGTCGLGLLDLITGYNRLVIVDAIDAGEQPGTVLTLELSDLDRMVPRHAASTHDANLSTALEAGRQLGLDLPSEIRIVAVQIADVGTFSEELTPAVAAAVDEACRLALDLAESSLPP